MFLENVRKIAHQLHKQHEKEPKDKLFRTTIDALLEREIIFENGFVKESDRKAIEAYWGDEKTMQANPDSFFLNFPSSPF